MFTDQVFVDVVLEFGAIAIAMARMHPQTASWHKWTA